ncbi:hypothetical protein NC981_04640 [Leptolyngbya sp. DQ-M1]|uniref:hypothetical protein n=1 Tax=Leptolyngbya sp. DQ-M1 TaxID=2933920 RepID=UPI00329813E2
MLKNAAIATLILSSTALATTLPAHALTIAGYDFGATGFETLNATTTDSNVTASPFGTSGVIATPNSPRPDGFAAGVNGQGTLHNDWALNPTLIDPNKYYTFTVTPNAGISMSLNLLTFAARRSSFGPQNIAVRSSVDNYAATLSTLTPGTPNSNSATNDFNTGLSTNLSGAAFENLATAVTFRIYGYGASNTGGTLRLDNVILDGTTQAAVPVPFGFTPIWGIAANGVVFGLRKLRNKQMKSGFQSSVKA